jgi:hypothetical protein
MRKEWFGLGAMALTLAFAMPSFAIEAVGSAPADDLNHATDDLHDAVNNSNLSNEDVSARTYQFSNVGLPSTAVGLRFHKYNWHEFDAPGNKPASVDAIMQAGEDALSKSIVVPEPEVGDSQERARGMFENGKLNFGDLTPNEAGIYTYTKGSSSLGNIALNDNMKTMSMLVSQDLLYATVAHEARHANDQQAGVLSADEVKQGEVNAFHTEYDYLAAITHNGEEIATSWIGLNSLWEKTKNSVVKQAADYVFSLLALYRTKGVEQRLKEYVDLMGYQEGEGNTPKPAGSPTSS